MSDPAPWQPIVPGWAVATAGGGALLAVGLLPPPPATLPPVRGTEGFTEWGWGRAEKEDPLYKIPTEAGASTDAWTLFEESEAQLELEPFQMEPVRVMVPISGRITGSELDLDTARGQLEVDLSGLADDPAFGAAWTGILAAHPQAARATVEVRGGKLGPAPKRLGGRIEGDLLVTVRLLGAEAELSLNVEVERIEDGDLLVSSIGHNSLGLETLGPLAGLIESGLGRHPGAFVGLGFGVDLVR